MTSVSVDTKKINTTFSTSTIGSKNSLLRPTTVLFSDILYLLPQKSLALGTRRPPTTFLTILLAFATKMVKKRGWGLMDSQR